MAAVAKVFALVIAVAAALAAAPIVLPAFGMKMALAAIVSSELSALIAAGAIVALPLAFFGFTRGRRVPSAIAVVLVVAAVGTCLLPLAQARSLAKTRGVRLDFRRYLQARIDSPGPGHPDQTVTYATVNGTPLALDVYLPHARPAKPGRPLVVIHGGFWAAGQKGEATLASRRLADLGFTVFDIQYRISPQPNWKTATGDVKCAIGWVKQHADTPDWNVDPTKLALLGRSAGGHLALMAAYTPTDPELPASCNAGDTGVDAVISLYAPTDLAWGYKYPANRWVSDSRAKIRAFVGGTPEDSGDRFKALSPLERVTPAAPRTLLAHGGRDQMVPHGHMGLLAARLRALGVPCETLFIPYAQHAFDFVRGGFSDQILEAEVLKFLSSPG
ncbi:MAG TPA: alpha/beta hydrolase [Polyangia bacterium]|nr:alpha/beta hydrolase [Polyangia bacterium]